MKRISALILALMICIFSVLCLTACGNDVSVTDEGFAVAKGDTVTYTFNMSDSDRSVSGIHLVLFYDRDVLSVQDVTTPNMASSTINKDEAANGQIVVTNALINGADGLACKDKTSLVTATFKANKDAVTHISYYIPYIYDINLDNVKHFRFTCDVDLDGKNLVSDAVPALEDVSGLQGFDKGDFDNSPSGKG